MSNGSDRPKAASARPLAALLPFLAPYRLTIALALFALLVAAGAMLALPIALRMVIDEGFSAGNAATINRSFVGFLLAAVVFGGFAAWRFYLMSWIGERVVADIRDAVYARVIRMDPAFFEVTRSGEVLSRLTTDTTLVQSIAGSGFSIALRSSITLVGALIMLALTSAKLTGWIVMFIPVVIAPLVIVGRRVRRLSRVAQDGIADSSGLAGETLNAIQTIQAFNLESLQDRRYSQTVQAAFDHAIRRTRIRALLTALGVTLVFGAITMVLWGGAHAVLDGTMSAGELGQFLLYATFVGSSAAMLSETWGEVQRAAGATERLVELLQAEPAIRPPASPLPLPTPGLGAIRFQDVSFSYPSRPDQRALNGVSLSIEPGETVAFVGPSGAGKSTTFQLLLRFYDPQSGSVEIDGVPLAGADPMEVRRRIGLVPQETVLFGDTARENIRYGRPGATDAEIEQAARAASAHEFLTQLPQGYDTFLGERGTRLSGGQRQRIAIARALLKDPPILLLDEATSSLDAASERAVQEALERLMEGRTTIIIAHRLATVLKADRIVVLDHGRVVDSGTHTELIGRNPLYARLAELQFSGT
ncbi:MAG: ABC transporter transmembrane domain-containing protein [Steroidobacteraceae bacterium]